MEAKEHAVSTPGNLPANRFAMRVWPNTSEAPPMLEKLLELLLLPLSELELELLLDFFFRL